MPLQNLLLQKLLGEFSIIQTYTNILLLIILFFFCMAVTLKYSYLKQMPTQRKEL